MIDNCFEQSRLAPVDLRLEPARCWQRSDITAVALPALQVWRGGNVDSRTPWSVNSLADNGLGRRAIPPGFCNQSKSFFFNEMQRGASGWGFRITSSKLIRWCKFNLVGGIGILVQFAALFGLKSMLHVEYLLATAMAVEIAVLHNFLWHERFTWADRRITEGKSVGRLNRGHMSCSWRRRLARLARFHVANGAVSIAGNLALMKVMVGEVHMNYLIANGIAVALCSVANFLVSEKWVFGE
jgi:putative flippase GtrA